MRAFAIVLLAASSALAQGGTGSGAGGGVYRVGGGVSAPVLIHKTEPIYTEEARKAKYQGTVLLYVEINPDGRPTNIKVQRRLGLGLDEKAIEAVQQWRFKPGMKDGRPVTVAATIEVNFRLLNGWTIIQQIYSTDTGVSQPILRNAAYPADCQKPVSARVSLNIASDGSVTNVLVIRINDPALGDAIREAVARWAFEPARWQGSPQPVGGEIELACAPK